MNWKKLAVLSWNWDILLIFWEKGFQDPLSVVLSLTGDEQEEERVDISINEMLEEYVWSKD